MVLMDVKETNGWLLSSWRLTYGVSWEQILKAAYEQYPYFENLELLVDDTLLQVEGKEELYNIEEASMLTIRGLSTILHTLIMITFINQTNVVNVNIATMNEEFQTADYKKLNMSLGQYMDSIEISMVQFKQG